MKVLAVFSLVLAVATSYPVVKTWTLYKLAEAFKTEPDPAKIPYLVDAHSQIMLTLFTGENAKSIYTVLPSPTGGATWTMEQIDAAVADPATIMDYRSELVLARHLLKEMQNKAGNVQDSVEVLVPALDISTWTPEDLAEALRSPTTNSALIPYLEKANNELKEALEKGETREVLYMVTPVGLIPPKEDYHYLPKPFRNLIKKAKTWI